MNGSDLLRKHRLGWAVWFLLQAPRQGRLAFRSKTAIEADQRRRLRAAVSHAYRHVPHYRETMRRLGLAPADISTAADLARLPLLERSDLQQDPERFVSDTQPIDRLVPHQTGGSTGAPLTVYFDLFALVQRGAHDHRAGAEHRRVLRRRLGNRTLFVGQAAFASSGPVNRMFARLRKLTGAQFHRVGVQEPVERCAEEINRFRPHIVHGPGSYLEALFVSLDSSGVQLHCPQLLVYSGDAMSTGVRSLISEGFGIPVLSIYGANEALDMGFECLEHLGLHFNADLYPMRIVDDAGRELPDGENGEVVVSNLVNRGTVLLNYRLGDVASKLPIDCPCGRKLPLLSFVDVRQRDWLTTPSGRRVHALAVTRVLDVDRDIFRYRVRQGDPTRLQLDLVARPSSDRVTIEERVKHGLAQVLGPEAAIEVDFVADLPRTARGKVRTVVGLDRRW